MGLWYGWVLGWFLGPSFVGGADPVDPPGACGEMELFGFLNGVLVKELEGWGFLMGTRGRGAPCRPAVTMISRGWEGRMVGARQS
jgi:hypothetical protein